MRNKKKVIFLILFLLFILLTLYLVNELGNRSADESELIEVTLRLQWHTQTQFAGYYVAQKKGFYSESGLKVNIKQGGYGENGILTVQEGLEQFGTKWMADLIAADSSLISLANIVKDNGLQIISKKEKNINSVNDFRGKRVSIWFIGNEYQLFALLDKYKIPQQELKIISQKWDLTQFYNDEADAVSGMIYNERLKLLEDGFSSDNLNILSYKELGVGFPGQNIFSSKTYYKNNPEICRKFVNASIDGWKYAIENPEEATRIVIENDIENILDYDQQLQQLNEMIKLIQADEYQLGIHLEEDYQLIGEIFKEYSFINENISLTSLYTNDLIE